MTNQGPVVEAIGYTFGVLTFVVICLRAFSRIHVLKKVGVDDGLIFVATILAWAFIAADLLAVKYGMGTHIEHLDKQTVRLYSQAIYMSAVFYNSCLGFIKTSVLSFYLRFGDPWLTRLSQVMLIVVGCQATANTLVSIFQCTPIHETWDQTGKGTCIDINTFYLANAALNIATDLLTYGLPFKVVWSLQMQRNQKIALVVILGLGLFACVASIIRITYIPVILNTKDLTYFNSFSSYWSIIETNVGILAACTPALKPIFSKFLPRVFGNSSGKSYFQYRPNLSGFSRFKSSKNDAELSTFPGHSSAGRDDADQDKPYSSNVTTTRFPDNDSDDFVGNMHTSHGLGKSSSEERMVPEGAILAQTQISTFVEDRQ